MADKINAHNSNPLTLETTMQTETIQTVHLFEAAGLGKAPYKFIGMQTDGDRQSEQLQRAGDGLTYTTNYCTSCDYCSTAIHNAYWLQSADGKTFKVGCDCIKKSGDVGMKKVVAAEESRKRKEAANQKRRAERLRVNAAGVEFNAGKCEVARTMPHPKGFATMTLWDYLDFCFNRAGGTATAADIVEKLLA